MNVGVIGSRTFTDYGLLERTLKRINITKIISGYADGADKLADQYAKKFNIPIRNYLPDWSKYGLNAGFIRNTDIVNDSDLIVAFHDGISSGTADSIEKAKKQKKKILIINF